MKKINAKNFKTATRGTSREINRQIALTLIRSNQPISRADLSRLMDTNRANVTLLVNELLEENLVREGATANDGKRGRRPTHLFINSHQSFAIAVDIRPTRTFLMVTDSIGNQLGQVTSFRTPSDPAEFAKSLSSQIDHILDNRKDAATCKGIGVVVPGMVDIKTGVVINAPGLGWRRVEFVALLKEEFPDIEIQIENSGKSCALSQAWSARNDFQPQEDLVFVSVSDGVGVGVIVNGELMRGKHNTAGEFGHVPLSLDGPPCACGSNGCWETYISNIATISRYLGKNISAREPMTLENSDLTIDDLIVKARSGDGKALAAIHLTARYLGLGLGSIINAFDPSQIYIGGEITEVWDLIEPQVREAIRERTLTKELGKTPIRIVPAIEYPRLRGAVALVAAPAFAMPKVA